MMDRPSDRSTRRDRIARLAEHAYRLAVSVEEGFPLWHDNMLSALFEAMAGYPHGDDAASALADEAFRRDELERASRLVETIHPDAAGRRAGSLLRAASLKPTRSSLPGSPMPPTDPSVSR